MIVDSIHVENLRKDTDLALRDGGMNLLLNVRQDVRYARDLLSADHQLAKELRSLVKRLDQEIDRQNDVQVRPFLQRGDAYISIVRDSLNNKLEVEARMALADLERFVAQMCRIKPCFKGAIARARGMPYGDVLREFEALRDELFAAYRKLLAENLAERDRLQREALLLVGRQLQHDKEVGQQCAGKAAELHQLFLASIQSRNVSEAQLVLAELHSENIGLGLETFLGSWAKRNDFYASAEYELQFIVGVQQQRAEQLKRFERIPVLS